MNYLKLLFCILVISFLLPNFALAGNTDFIPLNVGNWWQYRVSYAYSEYDQEKGKETVYRGAYTEKIEILKLARYEDVTAALFSNIPGGFYPGKATLIVIDGKDYYWASEDIYGLIIKNEGKIKIDGYDILMIDNFENIKLGEIYSQELSLPMVKDKLFYCDEMDKKRDDNYYCNWVRSIKPAKQEYFPDKYEYEIAQYTLPDVSHSYYVPGAGLTYFSYSHHGSLDEQRWNLQRYYISTK